MRSPKHDRTWLLVGILAVTALAVLVGALGCATVDVTRNRSGRVTTIRTSSFLRKLEVVCNADTCCIDHQGVSANATALGIGLGSLAGPAGAGVGGLLGAVSAATSKPEPSICDPGLQLQQR